MIEEYGNEKNIRKLNNVIKNGIKIKKYIHEFSPKIYENDWFYKKTHLSRNILIIAAVSQIMTRYYNSKKINLPVLIGNNSHFIFSTDGLENLTAIQYIKLLQKCWKENPVFPFFEQQNDYEGIVLIDTEESVTDFEEISKIYHVFKCDFIFQISNMKCSEIIVYVNEETDEKELENFFSRLEMIIIQFQNRNENVGNFEMLNENEKREILSLNNFNKKAESKMNVSDLFKMIANKYPEKDAIIMDERKLSYKQLDSQSEIIANKLYELGVEKGDIVPVWCEKNELTIINLLAVMKLGGAYLPIDPEYPLNKIVQILSNAKVAYSLFPSSVKKEIDYISKNLDSSKIVSENFFDKKEVKNKNRIIVNGNDKAYVIYTSGTTSNPKGVVISHGNIIDLVETSTYFNFSSQDKILQTASIGFDASTFEIWGSLLNGATLYLLDKESLIDTSTLISIIKKNQINKMFLSTSFFHLLVEDNIELFDSVSKVIIGGDRLSKRQANKLLKHNPTVELINGYGPTENTTFSTYFKLSEPRIEENSIPIGKPIRNALTYIVDVFGHIQAKNLAGELYLGGRGVALGYLNNPNLTNERFCRTSFNSGRLYKTGDLVYVSSDDDNLYFLGRIDNQIKFKGYRIEVNELIEVIEKYPEVEMAYCCLNNNEHIGGQLMLYVTGENLSEILLRRYLEKNVASYMMPTFIIILEKFPLTVNGKIDRTLLPSVSSSNNYMDKKDISEFSSVFIKSWEKVFGNSIPNFDTNFFELGVNSLSIIALVKEIKKLNYSISIPDIYKYPTLSQLDEYGRIKKIMTKFPKISSGPLTLAQKGIWFNSMIEPIYNISATCYFTKNDLDIAKFKVAIEKVIENNPELRMAVKEKDKKIYQEIIDNNSYVFEYVEAKEQSLQDIAKMFEYKEIHRTYDLENGPTFFFNLGFDNFDRYVFNIGCHHIFSDAYTINLILTEIDCNYQKLISDKVLYSKSNKRTLLDYAIEQKELIQMNEFREDLEYWNEILKGDIPLLDFSAISTQYEKYEGTGVEIKIKKNDQEFFEERCKEFCVSNFVGYVSLYFLFLRYFFESNDIVIGNAVSGRNQSDIQETMGNFAFASVIRSSIDQTDSFKTMVERISVNVNNNNKHLTIPFEYIINEGMKERRLLKVPYTVLIEYIDSKRDYKIIEFSIPEFSNIITPADFTFFIQDDNNDTVLNFYYKLNLFNELDIEEFVHVFKTLFKECMHDPTKSLAKINFE